MGIFDAIVNVNSQLEKAINHIADKIIARQVITISDLKNLTKRLDRVAYFLTRKRNYEALKAFCGGIASAFKRIDEISKNFEQETRSFISNIKLMNSHILENTEAEARSKYGGFDDIKGNLLESFNGLTSAIKTEETPKALAAEAKAKKAAAA
ncbi:hypothetical protein KY343_05880 [Candidatus Woesearchaeota archaeon]|nr:hypothetical protein [Candidatus Woesearchaeota archaeon]